MAPNMCVTINIPNFIDIFVQLLSIESLSYRLIAQPIILCVIDDKMAAQTVSDLE